MSLLLQRAELARSCSLHSSCCLLTTCPVYLRPSVETAWTETAPFHHVHGNAALVMCYGANATLLWLASYVYVAI